MHIHVVISLCLLVVSIPISNCWRCSPNIPLHCSASAVKAESRCWGVSRQARATRALTSESWTGYVDRSLSLSFQLDVFLMGFVLFSLCFAL